MWNLSFPPAAFCHLGHEALPSSPPAVPAAEGAGAAESHLACIGGGVSESTPAESTPALLVS